MVIEESLLMALGTLDELREIVPDEELTAISAEGWCGTVDGKVNHTSAGGEGRGKATLAFCYKD